MPTTKFGLVRTAARSLENVEDCLYYGQPALKVRGRMFVCMASHRSAEPDTLVVRMDFEQRDALIAEQPAVYYLTDHYAGYASVLVRLRRVSRDALKDLVQTAYRFMDRTRRVTPRPSRSRGAAAARR